MGKVFLIHINRFLAGFLLLAAGITAIAQIVVVGTATRHQVEINETMLSGGGDTPIKSATI